VVYLYDAAIRSCRLAAEAIEAGQIAEKGRRLNQAMAAVMELASSLDFEAGGPLARRLNSIYSFLVRSLIASNAKNDASMARGCGAVLRTLREGWEKIVRSRNEPSSQKAEMTFEV
jgi:flagellar protein FliS